MQMAQETVWVKVCQMNKQGQDTPQMGQGIATASSFMKWGTPSLGFQNG